MIGRLLRAHGPSHTGYLQCITDVLKFEILSDAEDIQIDNCLNEGYGPMSSYGRQGQYQTRRIPVSVKLLP